MNFLARTTRALCLALVGGTTSCALSGPVIPGGPGVGLDRCEPTRAQQMVGLLNAMREREGLFPLRVDRRLIEAAQGHAEDMAAHGFVGHEGTDGGLTPYRVDNVRYPFLRSREHGWRVLLSLGDLRGVAGI